jgi:hypothetical protein
METKTTNYTYFLLGLILGNAISLIIYSFI